MRRDPKRFYAGIGSRSTPPYILHLMEDVAGRLADAGWMLRTGGADGADMAFMEGCNTCHLMLPWPGFNHLSVIRNGGYEYGTRYFYPSPHATDMSVQYHPTPDRLSRQAQLMMGRNALQVFGYIDDAGTFMQPFSKFVVCWTPDGAVEETSRATGGTGHAIRLANAYSIPVFNLQRAEHLQLFEGPLDWIEERWPEPTEE